MVKMPPKKMPVAAAGATSIIPTAKTEIAEQPTTLTVRRTYATSGEVTSDETEREVIEVNRFMTDTARVTASASYKRNMGNYESAEVYYGVSLPCYIEEIQEAFVRANDIVHEQLTRGLEALGAPEVTEDGDVLADEAEAEVEPEAEVEAEPEAEDDAITEEDVQSYDYEQLTELATANPDLNVDPEEFPDNPKGLAKFRAAIWEALVAAAGGEEEVAVEEEAAAEEEEEAAAGEEAEPFVPYTLQELKDMKIDALKDLHAAWELPPVKVARGAKDGGKSAYIKAIIDHQESAEGASQ